MKKTIAGYGTWSSPLTAARVTAGALRFDMPVLEGGNLYWIEGRASEGGRAVVVCRRPDGRLVDITPEGFNVRTRVHEYGGGAYTVHGGDVFFVNFDDQRVYAQRGGRAPAPITAPGFHYADFAVDAGRQRLLSVREDHRGPSPVNTIVSVAFDGGREHVLAEGADFYSDPVLSPDGRRLAWLQWVHPNMPWDATEVWVGDLDAEGAMHAPRRIAGGAGESLFQPAWSPDGELFYVSDRSGWWRICRAADGAAITALERVVPAEAEFGKPQWTFSQWTYDFLDAGRIVTSYTEQGRWKLGVLQIDPPRFDPVALTLEPLEGLRAGRDAVYFIGGSATHPSCIAQVSLDALLSSSNTTPVDATVLRLSTADPIPPEWISVAAPVTFDSDGVPVHAFYYAPHHPEAEAPEGERPPLLVLSHGGPTAASDDVLNPRVQFWTSRGFAVLDVNYGGSTGFGRAYRQRLAGHWGIVDVADCVNGARALVARGLADPDRLAIRGGSAGGYTTLAALTFHDLFTAGASHYGVSDVEVLAQETHKFESRYLDSLIGPYPEARAVYRARSPIHFTERLSAALILFQGLDDKVVPPNQAEMMAEAARRKGLPVAYVPFAGEQHGFRRAENIIRSLEAELYFYGAIFGFVPADPIAPVVIDNLRRVSAPTGRE